jgi:hypothetical protein
MPRVPIVTSDVDTWGTVLNAYLAVAHNIDGSLKSVRSVTDSGAVGNGAANDAAAIQAAIDASTAAGGGIVHVPPGVYNVGTNLLLKANVILRGAGRFATRIVYTGATGSSTLFVNGVAGWGVQDLALQAPTNVDFCVPLQVTTSTNGRISNIRTVGGTHAGVQISTSCYRIQCSELFITGVQHNAASTGGVGLWLFKDITDCQFDNVYIESTHGQGLSLDAGTSDGLGIVVQRNSLTNVTLRNVNSFIPTNKAVEIEGAQRNTITNLLVDGAGAGGVDCAGILFNRDQAGVSSDQNVISNFELRSLTGTGINIFGGSGNVFDDGVITVFNTNNTATSQAITVQDTAGFGGSDANDNRFSNIRIDNAGGGTYLYAVAFAATSTRHAQRNIFRSIQYGAPTTAIVSNFSASVNVPLAGASRNVVEYPVAGSPTLTDGGNSGAGASWALATESDDLAGVVTATLPTPSGIGGLVRVTFGRPMLTVPRSVVVSPFGSTDAIAQAAASARPYVKSVDATGFTIGVATAPLNAAVLSFAYYVTL